MPRLGQIIRSEENYLRRSCHMHIVLVILTIGQAVTDNFCCEIVKLDVSEAICVRQMPRYQVRNGFQTSWDLGLVDVHKPTELLPLYQQHSISNLVKQIAKAPMQLSHTGAQFIRLNKSQVSRDRSDLCQSLVAILQSRVQRLVNIIDTLIGIAMLRIGTTPLTERDCGRTGLF